MVLTNKVILVISSERWGKIFISKHNYALTLAIRSNRVYFINPIPPWLKPGEIKIETTPLHSNLKIVSFRPLFPMILKFHAKKLFDILIKWQINYVIKKLNIQPDIVWDFTCSYLYRDLSIFKSQFKIFHPVDKLSEETKVKKCDLLVSISDEILGQYTLPGIPKLKVNHGLAEPFEKAALHKPQFKREKPIHAVYLGNLIIDALDKTILLQAIKENPEIIFHFIGPSKSIDNNLGTNFLHENEYEPFINQLSQKKNVIFHGIKTQEEVSVMIDDYDVMLLCYKSTHNFKCDNSHKVIEYFSTGKIIVSTYLSNYHGTDLMAMTDKNYNSAWPSLFKTVINNLEYYNNQELQKKRKEYALDNTYEKQIKRIETFITENMGC